MTIYTYLFGTWEALYLFQYNFTDPELFLSPLSHLPIIGRKREMLFNTWELWDFSTIHNHHIEQLLTEQKKGTKEVLKSQLDLPRPRVTRILETLCFWPLLNMTALNIHIALHSVVSRAQFSLCYPCQPKGTTQRGRRALTLAFSGSTTELVLSILLHVLTVLQFHLDLPHFCHLNKLSCFLRDQAITVL